jgi:hypothetical protein
MTMDHVAAFEGIPCRAWGTREFDATLLRDVPAARLAEFQSRVRPLADDSAEAVWKRLFRGIRQPFHYKLSTGWMGRALRLDDRKVRRLLVEQLVTEFGWADDTLVLLVYNAPSSVVAGRWGWVRDCLRAKWVDTWNNVVICSDASRWSAVYWEGDGPRCVNRGDRRLLPPAEPHSAGSSGSAEAGDAADGGPISRS